MKEFKGIKFSKTTQIFYKFEKGQLMKFAAYGKNGSCWVSSDYEDNSNNSKNWTTATKEQIKHYCL